MFSYSLSAQWRLLSDWASAHCRLIWIFAGLTCQFVGFCHDAAQIMAEIFLEMTQWKNFMSASAWVQVLDFTKSLVYSNCQNDRKCCFFLYCFFVCVPCMHFITYSYASNSRRFYYDFSSFLLGNSISTVFHPGNVNYGMLLNLWRKGRESIYRTTCAQGALISCCTWHFWCRGQKQFSWCVFNLVYRDKNG